MYIYIYWGYIGIILSSVFLVVRPSKIISSYKILYPKGRYNPTLYWVP